MLCELVAPGFVRARNSLHMYKACRGLCDTGELCVDIASNCFGAADLQLTPICCHNKNRSRTSHAKATQRCGAAQALLT